MTLKERDAIETGFTPRFSEHFKIHDGICTVCKCECDDHWMKLQSGHEGWIGCTGALLKRVQFLEQLLSERDSRLRGEFLGRDSGTPAIESRVDGDAA